MHILVPPFTCILINSFSLYSFDIITKEVKRQSTGHVLKTYLFFTFVMRGRRGRDRMVVGFTTTCASSAYQHYSCEFEPRSWRGVLDTTLCNKVYQ